VKTFSIVLIVVIPLAIATASAQSLPPAPENCAQRVAQPTPAERMQICELAQRNAIKRIAEIRSVPANKDAQYLSEVIENQRTQRQLIAMQTHIAEGACAVAFGEPVPVGQ
jgi:hypothetical protein